MRATYSRPRCRLRLAALALVSAFGPTAAAVEPFFTLAPEAERDALWSHYRQLFPEVERGAYVDGVYAFDQALRAQWLEHQQFAPYEFALDEGRTLFETPFPNGQRYADCFDNGGLGIRQTYPRFDFESNQVVSLERAINRCRKANGVEPYGWKTGPLAAISAYLAYTSRGRPMAVALPDHPEARAAFRRGREFFYGKRGRLNFSCADCHVAAAGRRLRDQLLVPIIGLVNHYPVYGLRWGELGTLHRRFSGCLHQIGAEPLKPQSRAFRELEYYLSYLSNDLPVTGPGIYR